MPTGAAHASPERTTRQADSYYRSREGARERKRRLELAEDELSASSARGMFHQASGDEVGLRSVLGGTVVINSQ